MILICAPESPCNGYSWEVRAIRVNGNMLAVQQADSRVDERNIASLFHILFQIEAVDVVTRSFCVKM
jgi:hypothetical protein